MGVDVDRCPAILRRIKQVVAATPAFPAAMRLSSHPAPFSVRESARSVAYSSKAVASPQQAASNDRRGVDEHVRGPRELYLDSEPALTHDVP